MHCSCAVVYSMGIVNLGLSKVRAHSVTQKLRPHPPLVGRWWVNCQGRVFVPSPSLVATQGNGKFEHVGGLQ